MDGEPTTRSPEKGRALPPGFRHHELARRRTELRDAFFLQPDELETLGASALALELSEVMVESAVGCIPVPLGIAEGFLVDGDELAIPMATEEPSVIAAASFAASLVRRARGFTTWASLPLMDAQVFLEGVSPAGEQRLAQSEGSVAEALRPFLQSLADRGGGYRGFRVARLPETGVVRVELTIDVRDAMGANRLNGAAEQVRPILERISGGRSLMAILSNEARQRRAGARFAMDVNLLGSRGPEPPAEIARRIVAAFEVSQEDPSRAVTNNKGIMNGITALALATFNDTRAVEAAAHAWAARDGRVKGLASYRLSAGQLLGELELPLPLGTVGGSVQIHPAARAALRVLGMPDAPRLARIAAALGLAQNLAALLALVTQGIQRGHMRYHAARLAFLAGARGGAARRLAAEIQKSGVTDVEAARAILSRDPEAGHGG